MLYLNLFNRCFLCRLLLFLLWWSFLFRIRRHLYCLLFNHLLFFFFLFGFLNSFSWIIFSSFFQILNSLRILFLFLRLIFSLKFIFISIRLFNIFIFLILFNILIHDLLFRFCFWLWLRFLFLGFLIVVLSFWS